MSLKVKILVVEDESIVAMDIKNRLTKLGYEVCGPVSSGPEAIRKVAESHPNLILMDIRIKGELDGVDTAEQIRACYDVPIIFLTAYSDEATLQRAKLTTPYGYLLKPLEERELYITIEMALYKQKMERQLKESEQWLSTTLNSIGDGVIATDTQGWIKFMNPVAAALTGWTQEETIGRNAKEVFHIINAKTQALVESPIERALQTGERVTLEQDTLLVTRSGQTIPIDDSAAPIRDQRGTISGAVLVFRDVTERQQAEEKLQRYALELQASNADLDAFTHTVAHDLQTPLNPIVGFADVLLHQYESISDEDRRAFLQLIVNSGRKMSNIIKELLLLAHVRQKKVETGPVLMAKVVHTARERLAHEIEAYQAEIISPTTWPVALGYEAWLEEVWVNYLSNALKYGGQPPRIELGAMPQEDGLIRFWIRDNGPGLTPGELTSLFIPFTRLSQVRVQGSGLGLSIVRRIVESLGGTVGVESAGVPGQGSTFSFTLPSAAIESVPPYSANGQLHTYEGQDVASMVSALFE